MARAVCISFHASNTIFLSIIPNVGTSLQKKRRNPEVYNPNLLIYDSRILHFLRKKDT